MVDLPYTVVGVYPDNPEDAYVEWVEASSPKKAVLKAIDMDDDRIDAIVVAVFEGHMVDKLYDTSCPCSSLIHG